MHRQTTTAILLALLLSSCSTTRAPAGFLQTGDAGWNRCLDEKVSIHVAKVDLVELFCRTAAFEDVNIAVQAHTRTGQAAGASANDPATAAAEERAQDLRISLNADGIARRDLLYRIARLCGLDMRWELKDGVPQAILVVIHQ